MTAFNAVRFKVKPGNEERFVEWHRKAQPALKGFLAGNLIKTGDRTYCFIGEWRNFQSIVNARPQMTGLLDEAREMLEDLGGALGVTDPVSGDVVVKVGPPKKAKKKSAPARGRSSKSPRKKPAKRGAAKRRR